MEAQAALVAIVDDDARVRKALLRLFRFARYRAEAFRTADAFLRSLAVRVPSCAVVDVQLPCMSGVELLRRLAALDRPPPVVMITAYDDECLEQQCKTLGGKRYFRKPVDCDALLDAVRDIVTAA
jgi:FixJ family two-component response regulator